MVVVCVGLGGAKRHHYKHIITMTFDQDKLRDGVVTCVTHVTVKPKVTAGR